MKGSHSCLMSVSGYCAHWLRPLPPNPPVLLLAASGPEIPQGWFWKPPSGSGDFENPQSLPAREADLIGVFSSLKTSLLPTLSLPRGSRKQILIEHLLCTRCYPARFTCIKSLPFPELHTVVVRPTEIMHAHKAHSKHSILVSCCCCCNLI